MPPTQDHAGRAVVTCDRCGTPYAAVFDDDGAVALRGVEDARCTECEATGFTRLAIATRD